MSVVAPYSDTVMQALQRQQAALVHIDTVATAPGLTLREAWEVVTETLAAALDTARVSVWFLDQEELTLICSDLYLYVEERHESGLELRAGQYPQYFSALTRERAIDAHDASTDPRTSEFAKGYLDILGITSMLDAPIRRDGKVVGVICLEHKGPPRRWRLDEVLCAGAAGDLLAKILIAHERRQVSEELAIREEQLRHMQKMEAIGQLAGGIAHDFNNMLAGIMGSTGVLEQVVPDSNDRAHRAIDLIQRSSHRASELVTRLLAFARKSKELSVPFDIHGVLDDTLTLFQRAGIGSIEIVRDFGAERSIVHGDPTDMQSALLNLCINAGDAMPNGGALRAATLVVAASSLPSHMPGYAESSAPFLTVCISDTGAGIPAEIADRIFEPFFTTKEQGKGTGLGLAAVYAIVHNHDGIIDVKSTVDEGTTFTIYLPLVTESPPPHRPSAHRRHPGLQARVLVVDDEELLRSVAQMTLEELGYQVTLVDSGEAAIEAVTKASIPFDLILLDMAMPGMMGEECFSRLRECSPNTPVLVSTGFAHSTSIDRMLQKGASGVVHKPYTLEQLSESIAKALISSEP